MHAMRFSIRLYEILFHSRSAMFKSRKVNGANSAIRRPNFSRASSIRFNLGKHVGLSNPVPRLDFSETTKSIQIRKSLLILFIITKLIFNVIFHVQAWGCVTSHFQSIPKHVGCYTSDQIVTRESTCPVSIAAAQVLRLLQCVMSNETQNNFSIKK